MLAQLSEADLTPFACRVLEAARALAAEGLFPSGPRLGARLGISASAGMSARDALLACVEAGLFVLPQRTYTPAIPHPQPRQRPYRVPDGPCGKLVAQYHTAWRNVRQLLDSPVASVPESVAAPVVAPPPLVTQDPCQPLPRYVQSSTEGSFEARFSFKGKSYRAGRHETPEAAHQAARAKLEQLQIKWQQQHQA